MELDRWQTKATWKEGEAGVSGTAPWEPKPSGAEMVGDLDPDGHTLQNY